MIDPTPGGPGVTEKPAADSVERQNFLDLEHLVPGALWRGVYLVGEALPDITYGKLLSATYVPTGEKVILRSFRVADKTRARAWSRLFEYKGPGLTPLIEAVEFEGRRIEVTGASEANNLALWAGGKPVGEKEVRSILKQISDVVSALHEKSIAHLNLKPETILVELVEGEPRVKIGGLEAAADFCHDGLMSISVDPFYAPPEAIGLLQHHGNLHLRAWDWWSVGRIIQELILGRHILGVLLDRDVSRRTPELLMRAERVLRENEAAGPRAGGVEAMPNIASSLASLLRGLLSSARDARWGALEVQRWLRGETVKDRYHLSAHERLFVWKDRAFSLSEAAEFFSEVEHWQDGVEILFAGDAPGTLLAFMAEDVAHRERHRRIQDLVKLPDSSAFVDIEPTASRDVVTGIALAVLSDGKLPVRIRGAAIDTVFLTQCLSPRPQTDGLSLVRALLERAAIQHIGKTDGETSRFLAEFERSSSAAVALAAQNRWVTRADRPQWSRLLAITLLDDADLRGRLEQLHLKYASSRDDVLDQLFNKTDLNRTELAVLAFVGETPDKFNFVTHEVWVAEKYQLLHDKGEIIAVASTWLNLSTALRFGPHLVGPWPFVALVWIVLGAPLALTVPGRFTLGLVIFSAVAACAGRLLLLTVARRELRQRLPAATELLSAGQCVEQARRVLHQPAPPTSTQLKRSLAEIDAGIRKLPTKNRLAAIIPPARFRPLKYAALASALVSLGAFCGFGYSLAKNPPSLPLLVSAWLHPADQAAIDAKKAADAQRAAAQAEKDEVKARKNRRKRDVEDDAKIAWSFRPSPNPQNVRISKVLDPSTDQNREAREMGEYLVRPYTAATIDSLIAVRVTTESGVGLMLYDGKNARIADKRLFVVSYVPLPRAWLMLGDRRAIFLDEN